MQIAGGLILGEYALQRHLLRIDLNNDLWIVKFIADLQSNNSCRQKKCMHSMTAHVFDNQRGAYDNS